MINIWLALREDALLAVADWTTLTTDQQLIKDAMDSHPDAQHISVNTKRDISGGKQWQMFSIYTGDIVPLMAAVESIFPTPNNAIVLGAWRWDGAQLEEYPSHPRTKNFMPDDVTYNDEGVETSRTVATEQEPFNTIHGQSPRKFT